MGLGGSPSPPLSGLSTLAGTTVHVLRECGSTWPKWTASWGTCEPQCFDRRTNCRSGGHNHLNSPFWPSQGCFCPLAPSPTPASFILFCRPSSVLSFPGTPGHC